MDLDAMNSMPGLDGLRRVYGARRASLLPKLRICIVGIGGVGSWSAEALARSAVGHLTLIDPDDITEGNINRQVHANTTTVGLSKVQVMRERILAINPTLDCKAVDDVLVENNMQRLIDNDFDCVIDAIDSIRFKAALINFCHRSKIKIITTGGAGGRLDPTAVTTADLSRTWNDALAAKVRSRLRSQYGFSRNVKRRFGIECVYSSEQPVFPDSDGEITHAKPGVPGATLDCDSGYGSSSLVTATFGFVAASKALDKAMAQKLRIQEQATTR